LIHDLTLKKFELITSRKQIQEIIGVLKRPKFNNKISDNQIKEIEELILTHGFLAETPGIIFDCRDSKDNFILEMAVNGKANIILTGDEDLLILNPYRNIKIIKYSDFKI
jgi:putative PIN family toxin of toxin-antitoxin system